MFVKDPGGGHGLGACAFYQTDKLFHFLMPLFVISIGADFGWCSLPVLGCLQTRFGRRKPVIRACSDHGMIGFGKDLLSDTTSHLAHAIHHRVATAGQWIPYTIIKEGHPDEVQRGVQPVRSVFPDVPASPRRSGQFLPGDSGKHWAAQTVICSTRFQARASFSGSVF